MKLTTFILMISLQVNAVGFAQRITLTEKNTSLEKVLQLIHQQSGFDFIYDVNDVRGINLDVDLKNVDVEEAIKTILAKQQISYAMVSNNIVLTKKKSANTSKASASGMIDVKGHVIDLKGRPLAGVTVKVKGGNWVTKTGLQGEFLIRNLNENTILVVSSIGYKTQEVRVGKSANLVIKLVEAQQELEDVVVNGVYERPVQSFTGAATVLKGEDLKKVNAHSIFAAIASLDPALRLVPNNLQGGNINQLPEIQLRGANSLPNLTGEFTDNPNAPLFILDGFQVGAQRIFDLDINIINTVTILKDATATAIYGSRGANGVLVITTIMPKAGKLQVTVSNDFRMTTPDLSVYNLLNAAEKLDFEKRVGFYEAEQANAQSSLNAIYNSRARAVASGVNTNWLSFPTQVGTNNRTSLYIQGGDQYVRYGVQVARDMQNGVMKGQDRTNYSGQFDLNYQTKKLRFQNSFRLFQNSSNESPYGSFANYASMNPYWKAYDENGNVIKLMELNRFGRFINPLADASLKTINKSQYLGIMNNFRMRWTIIPTLYVESSFSLNKQNGTSDKFIPGQHSSFINELDINRRGSYDVGSNSSLGYEGNATVNYNLPLGKHFIYSTMGANIAHNTASFYSVSAVGFPFEQLNDLLFANQYKPNSRPAGNESITRRLGFFLNGNYTYDNRYLADVSIRSDGSSQFGTNKRYGIFWSTGLGWNIHNEKFLKDNSYINTLRLRVSYGSSGSLNVPAYRAQTRYGFNLENVYDGELGVVTMGLGNPNLAWQDVRTLNTGLDATLFKNRLDLHVERYVGTTYNTITSVTLAPSTGFPDYSENFGTIQNTGYEFSARYKIIDDKQNRVIWSVNVGAATNKNILKGLSNKLQALNNKQNFTTFNTPVILLQEGQAVNTIFVVPSLGVDPISGREVFLKKDGSSTFNWDPADKIAAGISNPKWNGVFGSNFSYKGFDVNVVFGYRVGGQTYNQTLVDKVQGADTRFNVDRRAYDLGWTKPGDESMFTKFGTIAVDTRASTRFVQDDNSLTLNSLSIGYNFYNRKFVKNLGMRSLSLNASTNELFTLSSIQIERGINNPFARVYSLSLRIGI